VRYFVIGWHPQENSMLADPVKKFSDTWTGRVCRPPREIRPPPPWFESTATFRSSGQPWIAVHVLQVWLQLCLTRQGSSIRNTLYLSNLQQMAARTGLEPVHRP
jgi:hypothetical protein